MPETLSFHAVPVGTREHVPFSAVPVLLIVTAEPGAGDQDLSRILLSRLAAIGELEVDPVPGNPLREPIPEAHIVLNWSFLGWPAQISFARSHRQKIFIGILVFQL